MLGTLHSPCLCHAKEHAFTLPFTGLDDRLVKAVYMLGFSNPTLVQVRNTTDFRSGPVPSGTWQCARPNACSSQTKCIPLVLAGKDCLVRAKTGSGKTLAFALGVLQKLLASAASGEAGGLRALILVPTKELVVQTVTVFESLMMYCGGDLGLVGLGTGTVPEQATQLREVADLPHIVVATPGRAVAHLRKRSLALTEALEMLVVDEADLVLSYGYRGDMETIIAALPRAVQAFLLSATLAEGMDDLKRLVLRAPAVVTLNDAAGAGGHLSQFYVMVPEEDKPLLLFALIKLQLITGKTLLFVNSVEQCYRLKLFLERFSIPSAVLNSELPANSRAHIVAQFNKGLFDFLIATDTSVGVDAGEEEGESSDDGGHSGPGGSAAPAQASGGAGSGALPPKRQQASHAGTAGDESPAEADSDAEDEEDSDGAEAGVTRGVDFQGVTTVVNVDFPPTMTAYVHRVGRTARGGASGAALSFVRSVGTEDALVLGAVQAAQPRLDSGAPQPALLPFDRTEVAAFRYRVDGVLRGISRKRIKEARLAELRSEILASTALKAHFEDNPVDLDLLRHDKALAPAAVQPQLADIPTYLVPPSLRAAVEAAGGGVRTKRRGKKRRRGAEEAAGSRALKTYADHRASDQAVTAALPSDTKRHASGGHVRMPTSIYGLPKVTQQSDLLLSSRNKWKKANKKGPWAKGKGRKGKGKRAF